MHKHLILHSVNYKIDNNIITNWAVLSILSTKCGLTLTNICDILTSLSYYRSRFAIRRSLRRCLQFGLVEQIPLTPSRWLITDLGIDFINNQEKSNFMKERIAQSIKDIMEKATRWMSISDINIIVDANRSTIRRCLKKDIAYKSEPIPKDKHGAKQWALKDLDTTGWENATPNQITQNNAESNTDDNLKLEKKC